MNLSKKTLKRELICENILEFMGFKFIKKNPCSYLLLSQEQPCFMLFCGKKGIKLVNIASNDKHLDNFKKKFEECFKALSNV